MTWQKLYEKDWNMRRADGGTTNTRIIWSVRRMQQRRLREGMEMHTEQERGLSKDEIGILSFTAGMTLVLIIELLMGAV